MYLYKQPACRPLFAAEQRLRMNRGGRGEIQDQRVQREMQEEIATKAERRVVERSKQDTPGSTNCFWPPQGRILRTLSTIELEIEKVSHWVACGQSYSLYQLYPYCKWAALLLTLDYIIQVTLPLFAPPCSHHLPSQG